ncbi:MAG: hypothetical protein RH917_15035 [Lacipirellulaceae bacterium]
MKPKVIENPSKATAYVPLAIICTVLWCATASHASAQSSPDSNVDLPKKQANLAERYQRLELLAGRLAELSRGTQPQRAKLLREVIARSRQQDLPGRFEKVVQSLEKERFSGALSDQKTLHADLKQLLELMLQEDRDREIESERKRVARYLKNLNKLIRQQRGIKARNEGKDSTKELSEEQGKLSEQTGELGEQIQQAEIGDAPSQKSEEGSEQSESSEAKPSEGGKPTESKQNSDGKNGEQSGEPSEQSPSEAEKSSGEAQGSKESQDAQSKAQPSEGQQSNGQSQQGQPQQGSSQSQSESKQQPNQSPAERATERLRQAQRRMQKAQEDLEKSKREGALKQQEQALRDLETAKAELEKILRQLREEEMQRMLVMLEARFRKMLEAEVEIYDETVRLDKSSAKAPRHEVEIAAGRLSRKQDQVIREADRALTLLREDGTSVAFPEALQQARDDMRAASLRLSEFKTSIITQALEEDVIAALEETLAALQRALEELREQQSGQQQQQGGGGPGEQPLVDQLAELRMIRALQNRVNKRTKRYDEMIAGEQALEAELLDALQVLAERQERIFEATHDLHTGRNR